MGSIVYIHHSVIPLRIYFHNVALHCWLYANTVLCHAHYSNAAFYKMSHFGSAFWETLFSPLWRECNKMIDTNLKTCTNAKLWAKTEKKAILAPLKLSNELNFYWICVHLICTKNKQKYPIKLLFLPTVKSGTRVAAVVLNSQQESKFIFQFVKHLLLLT